MADVPLKHGSQARCRVTALFRRLPMGNGFIGRNRDPLSQPLRFFLRTGVECCDALGFQLGNAGRHRSSSPLLPRLFRENEGKVALACLCSRRRDAFASKIASSASATCALNRVDNVLNMV